MAVDKVIVTNMSALKAKYGPHYARLAPALDTAIAADDRRGLRTLLVAIDSRADMKRVKGKPVTGRGDEKGAKAAVDAVYRHYKPDYILLLGAPDVVPHIHLNNPMKGTADDDDDVTVPSDVPYACEAGWSRRPENFLGPTRTIGRLPDLVGALDPSYLIGLLKNAAGYVCRDRKEYTHFAVSAKVWRKSTIESVERLFGERSKVYTSPPDGPKWTRNQLGPRLHFINCHGNTVSPLFFGEFPTDKFFDAHDAAHLSGRVTKGSLVAAECCYGAELYDPANADGQMGISGAYLASGAYGFFGSTTIAYGPSEGQGQADLICRYFVESVMQGASLGRAALEAHQRFVAQFSHVDPSDLKTAVQFLLLGDPSVHPVKGVAHAFSRTNAMRSAMRSGLVQPDARAYRRERLVRTGANLARTIGAAVPTKRSTPRAAKEFLAKAARESGIRRPVFRSYHVAFPDLRDLPELARLRTDRRDRWIHIVLGGHDVATKYPGRRVTAVIVTMQGGRIVHVRRVHSR
jgi:hypothetical protein